MNQNNSIYDENKKEMDEWFVGVMKEREHKTVPVIIGTHETSGELMSNSKGELLWLNPFDAYMGGEMFFNHCNRAKRQEEELHRLANEIDLPPEQIEEINKIIQEELNERDKTNT